MTLAEVGPELPRVARAAIETWLRTGERLTFATDAPAAGVFVTLRGAGGKLRGCVGSIEPLRPDVRSETARSAVLAATRDPRFGPVTLDELAELSIEVSVLEAEQPIGGEGELDPQRYGVLVRDDAGRQGLLLPSVPGIDTPAVQVHVARSKAGIAPGAPVRLARFEVHKFCE